MTAVRLELSKTILVMMIAIVISAPLALIASSSSPAQPPASSIVWPRKDYMNQGDEFHRFTEDVEEDYGIWDQTPFYGGGGNAAPIPHSDGK